MTQQTVCKRVIYSGRVQGVGFRYTTQQLASNYPVTGYVRNLANGNVELVVEGLLDQTNDFLAALGQHMKDYITNQNITDEPVQNFSNFSIRY